MSPWLPDAWRSLLPGEAMEAVRSARTIALTTHLHPDGDALGSELALAGVLRQLGKTVTILNADPPPASLQCIPGIERATGLAAATPGAPSRGSHVGHVSPGTPQRGSQGTPPDGRGSPSSQDQSVALGGPPLPDLFFSIEVPDLERMGAVRPYYEASAQRINIDHHPTNTRHGTWNVLEPSAAALGEMCYAIIRQLQVFHGNRDLINGEIASCLYVAILTDTGRFSYSSTSPLTHRIAAALLDYGIDAHRFVRAIYETSSSARLVLLARAMATLRVHPQAPVAWMEVTDGMFRETGTTPEDTEGFINFPRSIAGMEVGILFREDRPGVVKVSLRSVHRVKVNDIALTFGGGGHDKAAGCTVEASLEEVRSRVLARTMEAFRRT